MKNIFCLIALGLLGLAWVGEKFSTGRMAAELIRLRQQRAEMAGLLHERDGLLRRLNDVEKLEKTPPEQTAPAIPTDAKPKASLRSTLPLGDWVGAKGWGFRGQATPQASIESVLWAAAGGDVATFKQLLLFSEETRTAAAKLLAAMPASARLAYPGPEDFISALTIKRIPLGEAQLVWLNQIGSDNATACVFLKDPLNPIGSNESEPVPQGAVKVPPQLPADPKTGLTYLSLQREGNRWRVVVPPIAIEMMAKELGVVTKSGS